MPCKYEILGCPWQGPFHEQGAHQSDCAHPKKSGLEIVGALEAKQERDLAQVALYKDVFNLLSLEKIAFTGWFFAAGFYRTIVSIIDARLFAVSSFVFSVHVHRLSV